MHFHVQVVFNFIGFTSTILTSSILFRNKSYIGYTLISLPQKFPLLIEKFKSPPETTFLLRKSSSIELPWRPPYIHKNHIYRQQKKFPCLQRNEFYLYTLFKDQYRWLAWFISSTTNYHSTSSCYKIFRNKIPIL